MQGGWWSKKLKSCQRSLWTAPYQPKIFTYQSVFLIQLADFAKYCCLSCTRAGFAPGGVLWKKAKSVLGQAVCTWRLEKQVSNCTSWIFGIKKFEITSKSEFYLNLNKIDLRNCDWRDIVPTTKILEHKLHKNNFHIFLLKEWKCLKRWSKSFDISHFHCFRCSFWKSISVTFSGCFFFSLK